MYQNNQSKYPLRAGIEGGRQPDHQLKEVPYVTGVMVKVMAETMSRFEARLVMPKLRIFCIARQWLFSESNSS